MKKLLLLTGIVGALALPALSQQNWNQFDRNRDGQITFKELRANGVRIDQNIRALDRNGDRVLTRRELRNAQFRQQNNNGYNNNAYNNNPYSNQQQPYNANVPTSGYHWSTLDTNRNGVLEQHELQQAGYQGANTNYNMYSVDLNRDGYIDQYEAQRAGYNGTTNNRSNNGANILNLLQVLPGLLNR